MIRDIGIYVIHAKQGYETHEKRLKKLFTAYNLEYELITDGDTSLFSTLNLEDYFTPEFISRIRPGTLSCTLNHIFAFSRVITNKNKYALIFENDPFFIGNFLKKISRVLKESESLEPKFIISLENTTQKFPSFWDTKRGKVLYQASGSRCAGAYLIDYAGAQAALNSLQTEKCNNVIDWWQNRLIERRILKMYWAHPVLVEQGSHNGLLCSSISSKQKSIQRRIVWNLQKIYKGYFRRLFPRDLIIKP